jgi:hypothetical protein
MWANWNILRGCRRAFRCHGWHKCFWRLWRRYRINLQLKFKLLTEETTQGDSWERLNLKNVDDELHDRSSSSSFQWATINKPRSWAITVGYHFINATCFFRQRTGYITAKYIHQILCFRESPRLHCLETKLAMKPPSAWIDLSESESLGCFNKNERLVDSTDLLHVKVESTDSLASLFNFQINKL